MPGWRQRTSDGDDNKPDDYLHIQFVQRNNTDTGWDPRRTRQLCNYSNLPSSFERARETTAMTTQTLLKVLLVSCSRMTFRTWLLANTAACEDNDQQDGFFLFFFSPPIKLEFCPRAIVEGRTEMKRTYMHGLLQAASVAECLEHSWWKGNSATGRHICQKSSEALHFAIRMLQTWRQSFSAGV